MRRLPGFELCIGKEPLPATANLRDLREILQGEDIDVCGAYNLIGTTEGDEFSDQIWSIRISGHAIRAD
jgi:hypothetical protein